jgi:hypothetical protein
MPWPTSYPNSAWLNPWPIKYLMPAIKWFPIYWPNVEWKLVQFPPQFDENWNPVGPKPPDGAIIEWWDMPKDQWPIEAPRAPKIFGCWPASQVTMCEDLPPSIWPGGHRAPPFGFIKVRMPGPPEVSGYQGPKGNQIPFLNMKINMRPELGPIHHHMKMLTQVNALGETKFYMADHNWTKFEYEAQEYRRKLKERKMDRFMTMLAQEIVRTKGVPNPNPPDLFS